MKRSSAAKHWLEIVTLLLKFDWSGLVHNIFHRTLKMTKGQRH